jgi:glycosyltransferase involved in cell wall biosynthesis
MGKIFHANCEEKRVKIIFAIKRLEDTAGGAERVFLELAGALHKRGHDVSILTFDRNGAKSFYPVPDGIIWRQLNTGDSSKKARPLETLKRIFALRKTIKKLSPDIFLAFQHSMFIPVSIACIGTGIPVAGSEHIVPAHYKNRPHEFALFAISSFFIKKITVLSEAIKSMYPSFLQKKMVVITNPVREIFIDSESRKNSKIILNVGRLDPQKDQKTLITAFSLIQREFPDWKLRIAGEGPIRKELENTIISLRLQDRVLLVGITKDIETEYENAAIFALSSLYESFGLSTVEAMGSGLPVVGFADCPGTNEIIIHQKNGVLVEQIGNESRAESMARALRELILSTQTRELYGRAGKEYAQYYKLDYVADKWEDMIFKIVRP